MKRIVEIDGHFEIQYKFLFWWLTYEEYNYYGSEIYCSYMEFKTLKQALKFIENEENNKKKSKPKVVWQSN